MMGVEKNAETSSMARNNFNLQMKLGEIRPRRDGKRRGK